MRWPWRRREPVDPKHGRLPDGRLIDGDIVRPEGMDRWAGLLPGREALTEPTQFLPADRPLMTPGQRWRSRGSRP